MKRFMFLAMLILAFFLISGVSAEELVDANLTDTEVHMEGASQNATFEDLCKSINETPENQTLTLANDYRYCEGDVHGIVISKSITIDGAGHTIDGNHSSRIFNVTADNVVLKNINFVNGNALGRYFDSNVGGGAIYWNGANGHIIDCNFTGNTGSGIEDDPFNEGEIVICENGMVIHSIRTRPMGARINEGGAITWRGGNGTVERCIFNDNHVGYPDGGGAICWRGDDGRIIDSIFSGNGAWVGAAVEWRGSNGFISSSKFSNSGISDNGIFWSGANGTLRNSIILSRDGKNAVNMYCPDLNADFNYWGDDISNPSQFIKPDNVNYWYVSKSADVPFDELEINGSFILVKSILPATAKIVSKNLKVYYQSRTKFKIQVLDKNGNADAYSDVRFYINGHEYRTMTDDEGYATLKLKLKPGKYNIFSQCGDLIVKNKITVKNTLITKNLYKKLKKSAKFKIKVLNSKGKAFKKQTVKIKFKAKTYKVKTDKNGRATFKVPKNLKVGKHKIRTTCNGLTNSNWIIVKK